LVNRIYSYFVTLGDIEEGRRKKEEGRKKVKKVKRVTKDL
jgi:hypothetical protein